MVQGFSTFSHLWSREEEHVRCTTGEVELCNPNFEISLDSNNANIHYFFRTGSWSPVSQNLKEYEL